MRTQLSAMWMKNSSQNAHGRSCPATALLLLFVLGVRLGRLQRGQDHAGAGDGDGRRHHHRLAPAERGGDQGEQGGQRHLADVAGEIVGAERGARAQAGDRRAATRVEAIGCCVLPPRPASSRPAITP